MLINFTAQHYLQHIQLGVTGPVGAEPGGGLWPKVKVWRLGGTNQPGSSYCRYSGRNQDTVRLSQNDSGRKVTQVMLQRFFCSSQFVYMKFTKITFCYDLTQKWRTQMHDAQNKAKISEISF